MQLTACIAHIRPNTSNPGHVVLQLGYRFAHILRRMLPIAMYLLQKDGQFLNGHDLFLKRVGASFHAFIDESEKVRNSMHEGSTRCLLPSVRWRQSNESWAAWACQGLTWRRMH